MCFQWVFFFSKILGSHDIVRNRNKLKTKYFLRAHFRVHSTDTHIINNDNNKNEKFKTK